MAAGRIVLSEYMPARDRNDRLVAGAKLYVYENGTTTLASIFADLALTTPLANPVVANASGQFASIYAPRGTNDVPVLYSLSVTGPAGESIGNPSVFDDFQPSADDTAAESAAAALASAEDAAADAVSTAADRVACEAAVLEAEVAAGASNTSGLYANTTAGLAGTADQGYFGVPGTDGIAYYLDNAGTAVAGPVQPSLNWIQKHQQTIYCSVVSVVGATTTIRPSNTWTVLTGNGITGSATNPKYDFEYIATEDSLAGSYNLVIQNGDGTTWLTAQALTDIDLVSPGVGGIKSGKVVRFFRRPAGTLELKAELDTVSVPLSDTAISLALKTPKPERPVSSLQVGTNLSVIGVKMHDDHYADVTLANQEDYLRVGFMDVKDAMGLGTEAPDGFMAINSLWANVRNQKVTVSNFVYRALDSGTTVETGLVFSAFENVLITGDFADAADLSKFTLAGRAHGHVSDVTRTRKGYRQDSSVGKPTAATQGAALTVTLGTVSQATTGERIRFTGVVGMTEINDVWLTITNTAFVGNTTVLTFTGVDSTGYGAFVSCAEYAEREVILDTPSDLGLEWNGIRIAESSTYTMNTIDGDPWAVCTDTTTFESNTDFQMKFEWEADFADASVLITPATRTGGYAIMCPTTGMNRCRATVNGVVGSTQIIDLRNGGGTTLLGYAEKVELWNADFDDVVLVVENIAGAGYTHFEDSGSGPVGVAYAAQVFILNNDYGPKLYWPIYPVSPPASLGSVNSISGGATYTVRRV